ncbi:MAG: cation diffusion facilitator family transporter [Bauldia sp.]
MKPVVSSPSDASQPLQRSLLLAIATFVVGIAVLGLKLLAWWLTGSIGLYSDALESLVNVGASLAVIVTIWVAAKPADANHPYGHTKAEYFSAVAEGVLIIVAAASILLEAWRAFADPPVIEEMSLGLLINVGATAINAVWGYVIIAQGRRLRSPALVADGRHLFTDVVTSVAVVLGVLVASWTGVAVIDPIVAALVAVNILWTGWRIVRESVGGLMDEALAPDRVDRIRAIISREAEGAIEAHDLRTRHAGRLTFVEFHLVVAGAMPVTEAHDICDRIERAIRDEFEDVRISIHVEPEDKAKHAGIVVV